MTARYQVKPHKIDQCKQAIKNLVKYVKENEQGTLYYIANQEILNPFIKKVLQNSCCGNYPENYLVNTVPH